MLSLILVAVILFTIYHHKKVIKFFKKLSSTDRNMIVIISIIVVCSILVILGGMLNRIINYNSDIATCNYYKNIVAQLKFDLNECDKNIEHFSSYSKLTDEEINTILEALSVKKSDIEVKLINLIKK